MQALEGLKVLDMTRIGPGPFCTMLLADMGADVLRVQAPLRLSDEGKVAHVPSEADERSRAYYVLGRNKRSIALDLRHEEAREAFYALCRTADVVIEGYRPGVVQRLQVDYERLSAVNPRIVYCSLSGYGQSGPYREVPGHDINYIALGGALALIGQAGGKPAIPVNLLADYGGGGLMAAYGIMCALRARDLTGRGQYVDIGMSDGVTQLLARVWATYFETGEPARRGEHPLTGSRLAYNVYQCKDGKWISIGSGEPWFYANFCKAIGREDFIPRQNAGPEEQQEMIAAAEAIFKTRTRDEWVELLLQTDQCVAPVLELDELEHHPHIRARELVIEVDHPTLGVVKQPGFGIKLSDTPPAFHSFTPETGEHTDSVLADLGYPPERIKELRDLGAVG